MCFKYKSLVNQLNVLFEVLLEALVLFDLLSVIVHTLRSPTLVVLRRIVCVTT